MKRWWFSFILFTACSENGEPKQELPPAEGPQAIPAPEIAVVKSDSGADRQTSSSPSSAQGSEVYVGTLLPIHSAELGPKRSGTLQKVEVDEGDRVKAGQVLFRLETQAISLNVKQNSEALRATQLRLQEAKRELDRQRKLAETGSIASAALDRTQTGYDELEIAVRRAQVALSLARRDKIDSVVTSPINGIVVQKLKSVGEPVTMMPPTTVLVIQDQSTLELRFKAPEHTLRWIHEGQEMLARFPALELTRPAKVKRIQPTIDPVTRTVEVVALVDNNDAVLKPGMYVEVVKPESPQAPAPTAVVRETTVPSKEGES